MQVTLSTIGRFHTFDLARQLNKNKALKVVFTGNPSFVLRKEELPREKIVSFPWLHAPFVFARLRPGKLKDAIAWQDRVWFDRFVASQLQPCDVFHALSGSALRSGARAKLLGATYVCDRGSSHIRFQDQILREEYDRQGLRFHGVDPKVIEMEEAEYETADAITVPSRFALRTFISLGISAGKMHLAPYGVDLARFRPTASPPPEEFRVLFAGSISIRKGILYLLDAYDRLSHPRKSLFFAGVLDPTIKPLLKRFLNRDDISFAGRLDRSQLVQRMSCSHVLVLPSVEEGLALVQAQALACGCPVVASTNTGAEDLFTNGSEGFIVPIRNSDVIADRLQRLADDPHLHSQMRNRALERVRSIGGWNQYGKLMNTTFASLRLSTHGSVV